MENLTDQEQQVILELADKHPEVRKLYDLFQSYSNDPRDKFHLALTKILDRLSEEMLFIQNNEPHKAIIISGEDKVFERIKSLLVDGEKIFTGITKGMNIRSGINEINPTKDKSSKTKEDKVPSYEEIMNEIKNDNLSGKV